MSTGISNSSWLRDYVCPHIPDKYGQITWVIVVCTFASLRIQYWMPVLRVDERQLLIISPSGLEVWKSHGHLTSFHHFCPWRNVWISSPPTKNKTSRTNGSMTLLEDSILDVRMCDTNKRMLLGHLFLRLSCQFNPPKWQWPASRAPCSLRIFDDCKKVSIKTQGSLQFIIYYQREQCTIVFEIPQIGNSITPATLFWGIKIHSKKHCTKHTLLDMVVSTPCLT